MSANGIETVEQAPAQDEPKTIAEKVRYHWNDACQTVTELGGAWPDLKKNVILWTFLLLLAVFVVGASLSYLYVQVPSWPADVCDPLYYSPIGVGCK